MGAGAGVPLERAEGLLGEGKEGGAGAGKGRSAPPGRAGPGRAVGDFRCPVAAGSGSAGAGAAPEGRLSPVCGGERGGGGGGWKPREAGPEG